MAGTTSRGYGVTELPGFPRRWITVPARCIRPAWAPLEPQPHPVTDFREMGGPNQGSAEPNQLSLLSHRVGGAKVCESLVCGPS